MIRIEPERQQLLLGYLCALAAAFCYGALALIAQKIVKDYSSPIVGTAFSLLFGTLILAVMAHRHAWTDIPRAPRRGLILMALAGCASTWGVSLWFLALNESPVVLVAPLVGTFPLISIVLTHLFLKRLEKVSWRTILGAILVVCGVAAIALGTK